MTTLEGLDPVSRRAWVDAFVESGASQCGFCTPGIIMRLAALASHPGPGLAPSKVEAALRAHLCRCTGWRTIAEAAGNATASSGQAFAHLTTGPAVTVRVDQPHGAGRDWAQAARRGALEGHGPQQVGPAVVMGGGGFADDTAPPDCLVAVPDGSGDWVVAESLPQARTQANKIQGRNSTLSLSWPLEVPPGDWDLSLRTTWVEPAYLEPDSSWCEPGGEPASPLANGGGFGGKVTSVAPGAARALADRHGRAVRVVLSRQDVVLLGPKRPPVAAGITADGTGVMRVAGTGSGAGWDDMVAQIARVAPRLDVQFVPVAGPEVSPYLRGAGWVEASVLSAVLGGRDGPFEVVSPEGARSQALIGPDGRVTLSVDCGPVLDRVILRSYCIGAAHMALGWVRSEGICLDGDGRPADLTMRSWGILKASETPPIDVDIHESSGPALNGSDAVFAAVAAAAWQADGLSPCWPTRRGIYP